MNAGEIGTEAGRIFEYALPSNWIFRNQEDQPEPSITINQIDENLALLRQGRLLGILL
jgi:hypothetical protein